MATILENIPIKEKAPGDKLDYKFDLATATNNPNKSGLTDWLGAGESIASFVLDIPAGLTVVSSALSDSNRSVTVWLSGGTVDTTYRVKCTMTTDNATPRIVERNLDMFIVAR